jgi:hypothetical protein
MCGRWLLLISFAAVVMAQLPPGAVVIERTTIPRTVRANRELVLWMVRPERHNRGPYSAGNPYACPERTLGSYYSGPTRISLLDTAAKRVLNTLKIHLDDEDTFDIPYRILPDYSDYLVPGAPKGVEGKPVLLRLRDLNGDGQELETAFFVAQACMGLPTTAIGYSMKQDRVIQYEADLRVAERKMVMYVGYRRVGSTRTTTSAWIDYLFAYPPKAPGRWEYQIEYRGRAGLLNEYKIRYDRRRERFRGTLMLTGPPPEP